MTKQRRGNTQSQPQEMPAATAAVAPTARVEMIAVAAYYLAEQRRFSPGQEVEDWLRAEKEIESRLQSGFPSSSG